MTQSQTASYLIASRGLPTVDLPTMAQSWNDFITNSTTMEAWEVSSMVLHAIARETAARTIYGDVWAEYQRSHDGLLLCYGLCQILEDFIDTVDAWQYVQSHLQKKFPIHEDESLKHRLTSVQLDLLRVSQLHLLVQQEIQTVACTHHIYLRIDVLEPGQEQERTHDE